jgi:hypothetical protein
VAGIDWAAHAHIDAIMKRFTSDLTLVGLGILILSLLEMGYGGGIASATSRCVVAA